MSDLTFIERMTLEELLGMSGGYVLDLSNRTFREFVAGSVGLDIYDQKYSTGHSGSKANCLRSLWKLEPNHVAGKLLGDLVQYFRHITHDPALDATAEACLAIATRLLEEPTMNKGEALVFISYARPDLRVTRALARLLADAGLGTWFDKKDLQGGEDWELVVRQRIAEASLVLVCLSTRAVDRKGFFHKEMRYAINEAVKLPKGSVYIIPVRLDDCEIPDDLRQWHAIDLRDPSGTRTLLSSIGKAIGSGVRARTDAHDALRSALIESYPFSIGEGDSYKLEMRLLAARGETLVVHWNP